jgi:tetratricopeptide (TPR) repeat protein
MDVSPQVFVVMPYGIKPIGRTDNAGKAGGSNRKVDFDAVYHELIAQALRGAGYEPFRADEEPAAGSILMDMHFELVTSEFVLADISITNANVFYELGIRHGVTPRGTIALHAGWQNRPFDVFPERTFHYDGSLFQVPPLKTQDRTSRLTLELKRLTDVLKKAFASDGRTVSSPVYAALPGLREVNWETIETARVKYFRGALDHSRERIEVARRLSRPGDILTLSQEAPTRYHERKYKLELARGFIDLGQFQFARRILDELVAAAPDDLPVNTQLCFVLNRLGDVRLAQARVENVLKRHTGDPDAQGAFGRIQKDLWRARWRDEPDERKRRSKALRYQALAEAATRCYAHAFLRNPGEYYTGINVLTLTKLTSFLRNVQSASGVLADGMVMDDLAASVRVSAMAAARRTTAAAAAGGWNDEQIWAEATLGELALLEGQFDESLAHYRAAASLERITQFQISSMLDQLELLRSLGYYGEHVSGIIKLLEDLRQDHLGRPIGNVVVGCGLGHNASMSKDRETALPERLRGMFEKHRIGEGDLCILGGLNYPEVVLGETCIQRGTEVHLLLPADPTACSEELVAKQPHLTGALTRRLFALAKRSKVFEQGRTLGKCPDDMAVVVRNRRWIVNTARTTPRTDRLFAIVCRDDGIVDEFANQLKVYGAKELSV